MGLSERRSIFRELSNIGYSWNSLTYLVALFYPSPIITYSSSRPNSSRRDLSISARTHPLIYCTARYYSCTPLSLWDWDYHHSKHFQCALVHMRDPRWGRLVGPLNTFLVPEIGSYKSLLAFPDPAFLNDVFSWLVQLCLQIYCSIYLQLGPFMVLHRTHKQHEYKLKPILESGRETDRCCRLIWDFLLNKRSFAELPDLLLMAWGYSHETLKLCSALILTSFSLVQRVLCSHPGDTSSKASSPIVFYSSSIVYSVVTVLLQESSVLSFPCLESLSGFLPLTKFRSIKLTHGDPYRLGVWYMLSLLFLCCVCPWFRHILFPFFLIFFLLTMLHPFCSDLYSFGSGGWWKLVPSFRRFLQCQRLHRYFAQLFSKNLFHGNRNVQRLARNITVAS